jgi:adenosylmethionine-8-amino-7-oxononanoate aminotransferase
MLAHGLAPCRALPNVVDVRAKGAIGVVQLSTMTDKDELRHAFMKRGVWIRPFGDIVYLSPALTIDTADVERLCAAIVAVLKGAE